VVEAEGQTSAPKLASRGSLDYLFLPVWLLCVAGDWLQGPYVYALYESYSLPRTDIARLFVAGFGSSMAFGTIVGSWVDEIGRKRGCQLYCILYILSCVTKHIANFWLLMLGRLTGGVATSLLFSAFEAWLIHEHGLREEPVGAASPPSDLRRTFGLMWFGSSLVAIAAGPVGDAAVGLLPLTAVAGPLHVGGLTAAFDVAILVLLIGLGGITLFWRDDAGEKRSVADTSLDNDGRADNGGASSPLELLARAGSTLAADHRLVALMVVVTGFESATYAFIFNWTPALTEGVAVPPALGSVFATLMLAYTSGSLAFQLLVTPSGAGTSATPPTASAIMPLRIALGLGPLALLAPALALSGLPIGSVERTACVLLGFVLFEFCCGLYAPAMSAVKGSLVPERLRSTMYNTYRAPMNAMVLVVLLSDAPSATALSACVGLLTLAAVAGVMIELSSSPDGTQAATLGSIVDDAEALQTTVGGCVNERSD